MRGRARVREARAVFDLRNFDFWEMWVLSGFTPVMTFGELDLDFSTFGKTCKFLQVYIHVLVKLILEFEITQVLNYLERIYYATKLTKRKISKNKNLELFLRNEWSSFDRLLINLETSWPQVLFRIHDDLLIETKPTTIGPRISLALKQSFIPCNISWRNLI